MPTFGSLFSGIGGLDLGLERAGWECKWQVEIDEWCRAVLARHWPDVPRWDDAATLLADADDGGECWIHAGRGEDACPPNEGGASGERAASRCSRVDLICGGFPCQPVSNAGRRLAQADDRWLWPEFARIVRVLRPRFVLVENVTGLLARGMGDVLGELAASGYDTEWDCIPAAAVGAPHLRYRVFVVAYRNDERDRRGQQQSERRESSGDVAHANGLGQGREAQVGSSSLTGVREEQAGAEPDGAGDGAVPYTAGEGWRPEGDAVPGEARGTFGWPERSDWWVTEPDVGRVANGVPARVDRLRALGNAVVPQVAEWIGRRLMAALDPTEAPHG